MTEYCPNFDARTGLCEVCGHDDRGCECCILDFSNGYEDPICITHSSGVRT